MKFEGNFPSSYTVEIDAGCPMHGEEDISFPAYSKLHMHTGEFRNIRFCLKEGASWIGRFELGERSGDFEDSMFTAPNRDQACVISFGAGYWVDTEQKQVTHIECLPITQAIASARHSLIIIATWRDLYAYAAPKESWSLHGLFLDRLRIKDIDQDTLTVAGFSGEAEEIQINLTTGRVI